MPSQVCSHSEKIESETKSCLGKRGADKGVCFLDVKLEPVF